MVQLKARERKFQTGDQVLVLLPNSTSKLLAQWQGLYEVVQQVNKVNYCIRMHDKPKKLGTFHINLLKKWNAPVESVNLMEEQEVQEEEIPVWEVDSRVPHAYSEAVKSELEEMLANNVIEEPKSNWSSPMVIVGKRDGTIRICVDYRKLNSISEIDAYPMPRIHERMDEVGGARYISMLDLTRGYWQIPVAQEE